MVITVTSLKLRSLFGFFKLSLNGMRIVKQTRSQPGFIAMKNTGFGYMAYTLSSWESIEDVKAFARMGAHLEAMKLSRELSTEIRIHTYEGEKLPDWKQAKALLHEKGRVLRYE